MRHLPVPFRKFVGGAWLLVALLGQAFAIRAAKAAPAPTSRVAIPVTAEQSLEKRWLQKSVLASQLVDEMEQTNHWSFTGSGMLSLADEKFKAGQRSIRFPISTNLQPASRAKTEAGIPSSAQRTFEPAADGTRYNRLSFWAYPDPPGSNAIGMVVRLMNSRGHDPEWDTRGCFTLRAGEWNHVVWEIAHLTRDSVSNLAFQSTFPVGSGTGPVAHVYLDQLEVQQVDADPVTGWGLASNRVASSQTGYQPGSRKIALVSKQSGKEFKLLQVSESTSPNAKPAALEKAKVVLAKEATLVRSAVGEYHLLDFSEVRQRGLYVLRIGHITTRPFPIDEACWDGLASKLFDFIQQGRPHRAVSPSGAEAPSNIALAVHTLFDTGERARLRDPNLADRFAAAARLYEPTLHPNLKAPSEGADPVPLNDHPHLATAPAADWFRFVAAEVISARAQSKSDTNAAQALLRFARTNWASVQKQTNSPTLRNGAAGTLAALELFRTTGEQEYANHARELAQVIVQCQQRERPAWTVPLHGFFYTSTNHEQIAHDPHDISERAAIVALDRMCATFPQHADWMQWYVAVVFYAEYLKSVASLSGPYQIISGSVFALNEFNGAENRAALEQGTKLDASHFLRHFPLPANHGAIRDLLLSRAGAAMTAAHLRQDADLFHLAEDQLRWLVGRNPFGRSAIYGEGFDFPPVGAEIEKPVGTISAGVRSHPLLDHPYWPGIPSHPEPFLLLPAVQCLNVLGELAGPATVVGEVGPGVVEPVRFTEASSGLSYEVRPEKGNPRFSLRLPAGDYRVEQTPIDLTIRLLPAEVRSLNLVQPLDFSVSVATESPNNLQLKVKAHGQGPQRFELRSHNLTLARPLLNVELNMARTETLVSAARVVQPNQPWVVVVIPNGNFAERKEIYSLNAKP